MKNLIKISIIIVAVFLIQCKKQPFDYRNKYVGNYEFTTQITVYDAWCCEGGLLCCSTQSQIVYNGIVKYGKEKNEIVVDYIGEEYEKDAYTSNSWRIEDGNLYTKIDIGGASLETNVIRFDENGGVKMIIKDQSKISYLGGPSHYVTGKKID